MATIKAQTPATLKPRIRVQRGRVIAMGPGKAELLMGIVETGSLSQAAKSMEMSYMRAWNLVKEMNGAFESPLVSMERGGVRGGGATLTPVGQEVLSLYQEMEQAAMLAMQTKWKRIQKLLKTD